MGGEGVGGVIGRTERLDAEPLEECSGPELWAAQLGRQLVEYRSRVSGCERLVDPKHVAQLVCQPEARRRPTKEKQVVREQLPGTTVVVFGRGDGSTPLPEQNPERLERNSLRMEHPQNVVVGDDEQLRRRPESGVRVGQEPGVHVRMRAYDREAGDTLVDLQGDPSLGRIRVEVAVRRRGEVELHAQPSSRKSS